MLSFFRKLSKSKITLVVLGIPLVASLLIFGNVNDVLGNVAASDAVVKAGDRKITSPQFAKIFENAVNDLGQRNQRQITAEEAAANGGLEGLLQNLASNEALMAVLAKAGIRPSDALLVAEIRKNPAWFNQFSGQFDEQKFNAWLAETGQTVEDFNRSSKDSLAAYHFRAALAGGLKAPAAYSALVAANQMEVRTFTGFFVDPRSVAPPAPPTDAQLQAFIKQYSTQLMKPERRSLTVVRFSAKALEPTVQVDPAEVQRLYEFRKDTLSTPERRTVVQVPAKDAQAAQAIAARLQQGEDPRAVARSLGVEPVVYTDVPKTAITDAQIANAAFALPAGAVSPPLRGALGFAVVKVASVTPGKPVAFAEVRPALEAEARSEAAQARIYEVVEKYSAAQEGGGSLKEAARSAGVTALELPPVTAQGADAQGKPQPMLTQKLLKTAFELPEGGESEVVDDGTGEYFAVRVEKIFAPSLPVIAQEREALTRAYMQLEMQNRLKTHIDGLVARVRKGESMQAVAASQGATAQTISVDMRTAQADQSPRRNLFAMVFSGKKGDVAAAGPTTVVRIDDVKPGAALQAARILQTAEPQMRNSLFSDIATAAANWARSEMKAKVDVNRARTAAGLQPVEPAKGAAKDAET